MTDFESEADEIATAAAALDDAFAVALRSLRLAHAEHTIAERAIADRRDMTERTAIVEQMARDVLAARRGGALGLVDLTEAGWSLAQVVRFGPAAHDLAATPAFATQDVVERLAEREGTFPPALRRAVPHTGDMTALVDDLGEEGDVA